MSVLIRGGVVDPTNRVDAVRDLVIRDGGHRRAAPLAVAKPRPSTPAGCVVMAGGIDMHTHIGGGKGQPRAPADGRRPPRGAKPIVLPDNPIELASCGNCAPGTLATGYRYAEMGYTAAFEPAMVLEQRAHAHWHGDGRRRCSTTAPT